MRATLGVRSWLAAGLLIAILVDVTHERAWVLAFVPIAAWALLGLILLWKHLFRLPTTWEDYSRAPNVLGVLAGGLMFLPVTSLAKSTLDWTRFKWHRSEYDAIVRAVQQGQPVSTRLRYIREPGIPARVAFPWPGGIIDNWCGAVHDPTAEVARINGLQAFTPEWRAQPLTHLFGGDMLSCRPLADAYYYCCFT